MFYSDRKIFFDTEKDMYLKLNQCKNADFPFLKMIAYDPKRFIMFLSPVGQPIKEIDKLKGEEGIESIKVILNYLKQLGIVHRDIRPQNFVIVRKGSQLCFLLIDLSCAIVEGTIKNCIGTMRYASDGVLEDWKNKRPHLYTYTDDWCSVAKMYLACLDKEIKELLDKVYSCTGIEVELIKVTWESVYFKNHRAKLLVETAEKGNLDNFCEMLKELIKANKFFFFFFFIGRGGGVGG
jgi:serine/threonine protein kinase